MRVLIVLPVLNEEMVLANTVKVVRSFCDQVMPAHETTIVIADNGSTDGTEKSGRELVERLTNVRYVRLELKGKGLAIRHAWSSVEADVFVFMDADLSTDLTALPGLVKAIEEGADVAIGSRFHVDSVVTRSSKRKFFSRGYRALLKLVFGTRVEDAPCGFKAVSQGVVREVVPMVRDNTWFFDTELLLLVERAGMKIVDVPITWSDGRYSGRESKVQIVRLVWEYTNKVFGLRWRVGEVPAKSAPGLMGVIKSISEKEWKVVVGIAFAAIMFAGVPALEGVLVARQNGTTWAGRSIFAPGDTAVYLNQIAQSRTKVGLLRNDATEEEIAPTLQSFWNGVGIVSRYTGMSSLAAYTLVRLIGVAVFVFVAYVALATFFSGIAERMLAILMVTFSGGVGAYVGAVMQAKSIAGTQLLPVDEWVAEAFPFLSMLCSPHFIFSWSLLIASLTLSYLAFRSGSVRTAVMGGLAFLALTSYHPYYAVTVMAVNVFAIICESFFSGFRLRPWKMLSIISLIALPAIGYQAWTFLGTMNGTLYGSQSVLLTPPVAHILLGFGGSLLAASIALVFWRRFDWKGEADGRRFVVVWFLVTLVLIYIPVAFQRRLLEGWFFPMVMLATPVLLWVWKKLLAMKHAVIAVPAGITIFALVFLPASASAFIRTVQAYRLGEEPFYFGADVASGLEWVRERTPDDARVLGGGTSGNNVLGWGERAVFVGHWALTLDPEEKVRLAEDWYKGGDDKGRCSFLYKHGITNVWLGTEERGMAPEFLPPSCIEEVFVSGNVTIYGLKK